MIITSKKKQHAGIDIGGIVLQCDIDLSICTPTIQ